MIHINLLKAEPTLAAVPAAVEAPRERKPVPMTSILGLFIVVVIALGFLQLSSTRKERNLLSAVQDEKAKLKDVDMKLQQVKDQQALILRKIDLINELKSYQGIPVTIMDELSRHVPYWVWLTEVSYSRGTLQIKGRAMSNTLIADYTEALSNSPYFQNVNLISSTQREMRGDQYLEFSMTAQFSVSEDLKASSVKAQTGVKK